MSVPEHLESDRTVEAYFADDGETFKLTVAGQNTEWLTTQTPVDLGVMR